jgi:hypothetical protein
VAPNKHNHVCFVELTPSNSLHHLSEVILGGIEVKSVQVEKNENGHSTDTLVAIDEGMVLDQVEQIGCCHLVNVCMKKLATVGSRWHAEGRSEQFDVSNTGGTTIAGNLVLMNGKHLTQAEEDGLQQLFRQLF